MTNVIVAFARQEDGKRIRDVLVKSGFLTVTLCSCGAQVLNRAAMMEQGIVVCGYRFKDMSCIQLREQLSPRFEMLLAASPGCLGTDEARGMVFLPSPFSVRDLAGTVRMMEQGQRKGGRKHGRLHERSEQEKSLLESAKRILMERNGMTEPAAHRYLQKCSMDSGVSLPESAAMVIQLYRQD